MKFGSSLLYAPKMLVFFIWKTDLKAEVWLAEKISREL